MTGRTQNRKDRSTHQSNEAGNKDQPGNASTKKESNEEIGASKEQPGNFNN